jgi:hypothetical protein
LSVKYKSFYFFYFSSEPSAIGIRQTQKAQAFNLMADGHRMLGLAKSYDAKAAAIALKTVTSEVL